jgi:solute carrier family 25 oxoglutarate transporter 11
MLYRGLSAGILRQMTYGTTRLGVFQTLENNLKDEKGVMSFGNKLLASLGAGGIGALVGTPADAALVRI